MTTTVTNAEVASLPTKIAAWISGVIELTHKQAAALLGILTTAGVIRIPAGSKGGYVFLGYAALAHIAENLFSPKGGPR